MRHFKALCALSLSVISVGTGLAYFTYLQATPFPPTTARIVPLIWLGVSCLSVALALQKVKDGRRGAYTWIALLLGVPSALFALLFSAAAMLGD